MSAPMNPGRRLLLTSLIASALVIAGAPPAAVEAQGNGQQGSSAASQAASLVTRWTIIVSNRFEQSKAYKSDETDGLIDEFISGGAVRAVSDKAATDKLREADATVDRFTAAVIRAGERHEDGTTEVTDAAVMAGVKSTCPVYPFC